MKVKELLCALEQFAPLPLQDGFDNAGLQIGLTETEVTGALLCLDVTEAVLDEAMALGYNVVLSHHPLIFHGLKSITGRNYVERCIMKAIKNDILLYAAHTNLDNAPGGVNYKIAEKIGLKNVRPLVPKEANNVGTHPGASYDGTNRDVSSKTELRTHQGASLQESPFEGAGSGVIGELDAPETELEFLRRVKKTFEVGCLRHNRLMGREIQTVALCGGAGAFLIPEAIRAHADVFLTGEIKYHDYFGHEEKILLAEIGHYESEQYTKEIFYTLIRDQFPGLEVQMTKLNTNPVKYL